MKLPQSNVLIWLILIVDALLKITILLAFLNNGNKPTGTVPPKELGTLRSLNPPLQAGEEVTSRN